MKRVAVVGGTGFIGNPLVRALVNAGLEVRSVSRHPVPQPGAQSVEANMTDAEALKRAFHGVDTVFHLAAFIPNAFTHDAHEIREGNRLGADGVVTACRAEGVQTLVYLTGHLAPPPEPSRRDLAFLEGKVAAEEIILGANSAALATCSVRAPVIFGPADKITQSFVDGHAPAFPRFDRTFGFMSVTALLPLLLRTAERLAARDPKVVGQAIDIAGERMTFEAFFALPGWGRAPPLFLGYAVVRALAVLNNVIAAVFKRAPLGVAMCPQVLDSLALHHRKEGGRPAIDALELTAETQRPLTAAILELAARDA